MSNESGYSAGYKGTKGFTQNNVHAANATGFGAAADDYSDRGIDLNEQLVKNKPATYFFKMNGDAMIGAGIFNGDILIVDRSIKATNGKIIIAVVEGDLVIRRLHQTINSAALVPANPRLSIINLEEQSDLKVWGVVTYNIHSLEDDVTTLLQEEQKQFADVLFDSLMQIQASNLALLDYDYSRLMEELPLS